MLKNQYKPVRTLCAVNLIFQPSLVIIININLILFIKCDEKDIRILYKIS